MAELDSYISYEVQKEESASAEAVSGRILWETQVAVWKDPLTLPHSRISCAKWAYPWPGAKICIGHKYEWQWLYGHLWLVITLGEPADIQQAINDALRDAAVVTAIGAVLAAVATGGIALSGAIGTFVTAFEISLARRISAKLISVRAENRTAWGNWE